MTIEEKLDLIRKNKNVIIDVLRSASNELSNNSCNDLFLKDPEERKNLAEMMGTEYPSDYSVLNYLCGFVKSL